MGVKHKWRQIDTVIQALLTLLIVIIIIIIIIIINTFIAMPLEVYMQGQPIFNENWILNLHSKWKLKISKKTKKQL
jgi:uncharacterized protein YneF (UPF0154 family)